MFQLRLYQLDRVGKKRLLGKITIDLNIYNSSNSLTSIEFSTK